jgi:hypothetical protein
MAKFNEVEGMFSHCRVISGSLSEKKKIGYEKQVLTPDEQYYFFAVAVEKDGPGTEELINQLMDNAYDSYAGLAGSKKVLDKINEGLAVDPNSFSWKMADGDTHDHWSKSEHCHGCYILFLNSNFDVNVFDGDHINIDPAEIYLGCYVDVFVTSSINGRLDGKAGIYINPRGVRFDEDGDRISVSADPGKMFGATTGRTIQRQAAKPMPAHLTNRAPGQAGAAPGRAPAPAGVEDDETWNMRHTGEHAAGYRYNPETDAWDVSDAGNVPARGRAAPAPAPARAPAPSAARGGQGPYSRTNTPPVTQRTGVAGGRQRS